MRLLICAGGTGGGVYPALAVLRALQTNDGKSVGSGENKPQFPTTREQIDTIWIAGEGGIEVDLLSREDIPFAAIPAAGVHGVGLRALPGNLWKIIKGFFAARRILRDFQPQVLFFTGGYLAVPVVLAGRFSGSRKQRPRIVVYVPDIEPGLALRFTARFSDQILLTVEESMNYFDHQSNLIVTGYPTRLGWDDSTRNEANQLFDLQQDLPTLLVFGGSKGARSINQALISILPQILTEMQIIHISGQVDWPEIKAAKNELPTSLIDRYHAFPYLYNRMGAAMKAADLVVSRAGASILGEFPTFGLPAILIPYPHAWRYQEVNAHYLEKRGAALVLQDHELKVHLLSTIIQLMTDHQTRSEMSRSMSSMATPQAAESIADLIRGLVALPSLERI